MTLHSPVKIAAAEDIYIADINQFDLPGHGACYIIDAHKKAIVETGTSLAVSRIISGLDRLGIGRSKLEYIFVTHLHLDHAGGAGFLANQYPHSKIIVNRAGTPHLIDPSYLVKSVKRAVGNLFEYYGDPKPVPEERVISLSGGERFDLGDGLRVKAINTPGHAPHHTCFYEEKNKSLFAGDACGIYFKPDDNLLPATPPPSFDLEDSLESIDKLSQLDLKAILYTHYGAVYDPYPMLKRYQCLLKDWILEIKKARGKLGDDRRVIDKMLNKYSPRLKKVGGNAHKIREEVAMNVKGALLYLDHIDRSGDQR